MARTLFPPCSSEYRAAHDSGPRLRERVRFIVLHSTEGGSAEGAASWFRNPASEGSANLVVDGKGCYSTVPDLVTPWAAPPLNSLGWHLEFAGFAAWTRTRWLLAMTELRRGAYKAALRADDFGIPLAWRDADYLRAHVGEDGSLTYTKGLRSLVGGFTDHATITAAFPAIAAKIGSHHDPGPGFPRDTFMWFVRRYSRRPEIMAAAR